jgi:quinohemoprotein ethanol dehydrogenase
LDRGALLFGQHCGVCHSLSDEPGGYPNLLRLPPGKHAIFDEIVLRGALAGGGMANFSNELSEADAHAIHAYLIDKAYEASAKR